MNHDSIISRLESEWESEGFLGRLRLGQFSQEEAERFLGILSDIRISENDQIPKRLLSLLWYLPSFLSWQKARVIELGGDSASYERFSNAVVSLLENSLGVP